MQFRNSVHSISLGFSFRAAHKLHVRQKNKMAACDKLYHYVACSFLSTNLDIFLVIHADLLLAATVSLKNWWTILRLSLLILNLFKCRELSAIVQRYTFHPASLNFFDPCHFWKHKYGNLCRIEREFRSLCDHYVCLNWEWVLLWEIRWGPARFWLLGIIEHELQLRNN